uniref:Uncharacterized protein n=1 Tax=Arundo donax TaxID=35708 RepID=A0A0A8YHX0_ARUDO
MQPHHRSMPISTPRQAVSPAATRHAPGRLPELQDCRRRRLLPEPDEPGPHTERSGARRGDTNFVGIRVEEMETMAWLSLAISRKVELHSGAQLASSTCPSCL